MFKWGHPWGTECTSNSVTDTAATQSPRQLKLAVWAKENVLHMPQDFLVVDWFQAKIAICCCLGLKCK